jgi:hypothetical protein
MTKHPHHPNNYLPFKIDVDSELASILYYCSLTPITLSRCCSIVFRFGYFWYLRVARVYMTSKLGNIHRSGLILILSLLLLRERNGSSLFRSLQYQIRYTLLERQNHVALGDQSLILIRSLNYRLGLYYNFCYIQTRL